MSKKFWVCCQNAHPESIWTSSNDSIPRIRTLRDRISRGMTVYLCISSSQSVLEPKHLLTTLQQYYSFKGFIQTDRSILILMMACINFSMCVISNCKYISVKSLF